ncbi:MAG: cytochrome c family protein [Alphaproteobacteria bacterium]|nr:cytochrome c family protein [Alphaproteobacteria bacterium]MBU0796884.1 cytochrome c family protein [Alphaproteobacteria bacterium]MBU0886920.1 cytochrome c family protein [Alphaproteobacteria bacterium]MBU1813224.1 cytochrome c family protein [Alphaproteobacteria bacterium]MBU2091053.1 cytochrome c family protein [Alphaproteobacteria bacterium]
MRKPALIAFAMMAATAAVSTPALAAGDAAAGQKAFNKCRACHVADKETNRVGPHLVGIVGRKAGAVENFKYSDAMKKAGEGGLVWTTDNIAQYMKNPKGFVAGNKMAFAGIKNDGEIADLVAYLESAGK